MQSSAFIAVIGRPSVGKSTLVNQVCGYKVSIVSSVPQTTRNAIRGIFTEDRGQLVFVDTPGFHDSERKFNLKLKDIVKGALDDCDVVLYVLDAARHLGEEEKAILEILSRVQVPVVIGLNKTDLYLPQARPEPGAKRSKPIPILKPDDLDHLVNSVQKALPKATLLRFSAMTGLGIAELKNLLFQLSPKGQAWYPADFSTDQEPQFRIAEVIREQVMNRTREEIPHASFIEIDDLELRNRDGKAITQADTSPWFGHDDSDTLDAEEEEEDNQGEEPGDTPSLSTLAAPVVPAVPADWSPADLWDLTPAQRPKLWIRAHICVERDSQKGILIGHEGTLIRTIRLESEKQLRELFPYRIELDLRVKVSPKWRSNEKIIQRLIH